MLATMHYQEEALVKDEALSLRDHVFQNVLAHLKEQPERPVDRDVYAEVMHEVERILIERALLYCRYNQSKAAKMLGLNRGTFRKKLEYHGML